MAKLKNKKTLKKIRKLKDFTSNTYSYLQVILFQCKIKAQRLEKNPNPLEIENLVQQVLGKESLPSSGDQVRANSLKVMYSMLRESKNLYPSMQKRLLKRFIEKQVLKLKQLSEQAVDAEAQETLLEAQIETFNELLSAHKELIELTEEHTDRFAFLNQASRLMDQAMVLAAYADNARD